MAKKLLYFVAVTLLLAAVSQGPAWADNGPDHQQEQIRPIKLGTSGGNIDDISMLYCCSGTLGALVEAGNEQYILSNNHVLARTNLALPGEEIIQPGLIDQGCAQDTGDTVAFLSDFVRIRFKKGRAVPLNEVDAAIAQVVYGAVEPNGAILDIGVVGPETITATIGQAVKKSGRTTGFTTGTVTAVGVTVDVGYSKECGGSATQVARFKNQIFIGGDGFSAGGDSGSLVVENVASKPRAVGLLFAGSSTTTVANPIDAVLSAFGVTMPGGTPPDEPEPPATGAIKGTVTNKTNGDPIEGATVTVDTGGLAITPADGTYVITDVPVGERSVKASAAGFKPQTSQATVNEGQETVVNFALKPSKGRGKSAQAAVNRAIRVKNRHEQNIFQIDGVVGTGVSLSETGQPVIEIYLKQDSAQSRARIPAALDNVPVRVLVTGQFEAF